MHTDSGYCRPSYLLPGSWVPYGVLLACSAVRQASELPRIPDLLAGILSQLLAASVFTFWEPLSDTCPDLHRWI